MPSALPASELRYRRLFEAAQDGILILDAQTAEIRDVNPFLCDLLGYSHDQMVGWKLWEIGAFKDVPASKCNFRELQQKDYIRYDDLPLKTAAGRSIAVEFVSNVYSEGRDNVIQCNIRDITQRTEEHARLLRAIRQTEAAILITDRQGAIVYVNPSFERVSGWTSEEALGLNPRILKSGKQDDTFYRQMWAALARGEVWSGRLVNRRKDGTLVEQEACISPVRDGAGEIVNYVTVQRDASREARLEQQLFQVRKMQAVGRLAGGVAEDFNNLLEIIAGCGERIHRQLADADPLKEEVAQILKAAERGEVLTRQLLTFRRTQLLQPKVLDLNAIVGEVERLLRQLLGEKVELVTRLAPQRCSVRADRGQIEHVITNLVVNARDALAGAGRITIETHPSAIDTETGPHDASSPSPGSYVTLAVSDTGPGMDAATQSQIFDPFFATKEIAGGTGLDLATVYGIVDQSGGFVRVHSKVGGGTTFRICLPNAHEELRSEHEGRPLPMRLPSQHSAETVLLVEDEETLRELVRRSLETSGYSVLTARDGGDALQIADTHDGPIEIMVTDVLMPGLTGPETARLIAQTRPLTKVLFISGFNQECVTSRELQVPGRAFLGKPFRLEALLHSVRELLDVQDVPLTDSQNRARNSAAR